MAADGAQVEEEFNGQGHNPFMVLVHECGLEPLQFNC